MSQIASNVPDQPDHASPLYPIPARLFCHVDGRRNARAGLGLPVAQG